MRDSVLFQFFETFIWTKNIVYIPNVSSVADNDSKWYNWSHYKHKSSFILSKTNNNLFFVHRLSKIKKITLQSHQMCYFDHNFFQMQFLFEKIKTVPTNYFSILFTGFLPQLTCFSLWTKHFLFSIKYFYLK